MASKSKTAKPFFPPKVFLFFILFCLGTVVFLQSKTEKVKNVEPQSAGSSVPKTRDHSLDYLRQAPLSEVESLANQGNPDAQDLLGAAYYFGSRGVSKNLKKSIEWFTKAAQQGNAESALMLWLISVSPNTPDELRNTAEGIKWLKTAAESGLTEAQSAYGRIMLGVYGGDSKHDQAFLYLQKAAQKDDKDATYWLGECYANGWGTSPNPGKAIHYLTLAADSEKYFAYKNIAQQKLAEAYKYGYGVNKDSKTAFEYFEKSAFSGNPSSQASLAQAYLKGDGVVPSTAAALVWIYVNRASGGAFSDKLVSLVEQEFSPSEITVIRNKAREIVANIKTGGGAESTPHAPPGSRKVKSTGTGVIISSDGLVLTAAHVVKGAGKIEVCLPSGKKTAIVAKSDPSNDLALLVVDAGGLSAAPLSPSSNVKLGQPVFTIGFPNTEIQGTSPKFTKGEISSLAGIRDEPTQWQISVPVQSENSGSPLFDESGNVVGIVVSKLDAIETAKTTGDLIQNVNYAVKNAYLEPMLQGFKIKKANPKTRGIFKSFESVVEDSKKSVVLILAY